MKYVIIGNSAAAAGCVEGIRQIDKEGPITVISKEPHHIYSRPLISYLLAQKTDLQKMKYRPNSFYENNGVTAVLGVGAAGIDRVAGAVVLEDDTRIPYDRLLVACGSSPFVPKMAGLEDVEKSFAFMSLDDALGLEKAITPESRVLIIGAGLIGLKCAEGIQKRVKSITVVDLADRVLPSILDAEGSRIIQNHLEKQGIAFILGNSVKEFGNNTATLQNDLKIPFDVLVVAVGVRPNTSLVSEAGGKVGRGIATDERCETSLKGIYAAGDCAESFDITTDESRVLALLPNAYMQGECAGINMAGGEKRFDKAIPMNSIGLFGMHIMTAGSYSGDGEYLRQTEEEYKRLITRDNLLVGFILMGDIRRAGIYTSLIREKTPLDTVDFGLICERPQLMAFTAKERAKKLGGAK